MPGKCELRLDKNGQIPLGSDGIPKTGGASDSPLHKQYLRWNGVQDSLLSTLLGRLASIEQCGLLDAQMLAYPTLMQIHHQTDSINLAHLKEAK